MSKPENGKPDPPDLNDLLALIGLGVLFYGLHGWYAPAAYITLGALLFLIAIARSRG
ncbi:hypothetical protein HQN89_10970 [Paenibacillus frigoriresistens]|uniref:hypothetical protein n=1 Tax=Paenibacillus alginolyticus TaxID=59839 RepID=UPI001566BC49|nr:hypothetical protein [Paenibacillus frigoriresistens]NRF91541.1 hypothetical protein [Paenibacillus frigoriresistens]